MAEELRSSRKDTKLIEQQRKLRCENLSFAAKEAYKRLRTNVQFCFTGEESCRVIGVTSPQPSEGKSMTAINLAYSMAQTEKKVLLIDADMRRSSIGGKLEMESGAGLSNLLTTVGSINGVLRRYAPSDGTPGFDVITGGVVPPNPSELLNSERMASLMRKLREAYDFIIVDLPPVGAVADAQTVARLTDGMLVVMRENHCTQSILNDCLAQLKLANAKVLGFVLNGSVAGSSKVYSYNKYYK